MKGEEGFGKYGKIAKIVVNKSNLHNTNKVGVVRTPTVSTYITYARPEDAMAAVQAIDSTWLDGKLIRCVKKIFIIIFYRCSFGTTKYCAYFLRGIQCTNADCMYLHEYGNDDDTFNKEDIVLKNGLPVPTNASKLPHLYPQVNTAAKHVWHFGDGPQHSIYDDDEEEEEEEQDMDDQSIDYEDQEQDDFEEKLPQPPVVNVTASVQHASLPATASWAKKVDNTEPPSVWNVQKIQKTPTTPLPAPVTPVPVVQQTASKNQSKKQKNKNKNKNKEKANNTLVDAATTPTTSTTTSTPVSTPITPATVNLPFGDVKVVKSDKQSQLVVTINNTTTPTTQAPPQLVQQQTIQVTTTTTTTPVQQQPPTKPAVHPLHQQEETSEWNESSALGEVDKLLEDDAPVEHESTPVPAAPSQQWDTLPVSATETKRKTSRFHFAANEESSSAWDISSQDLQQTFRALLPNVNINFSSTHLEESALQQQQQQQPQQSTAAWNNSNININNNINNININIQNQHHPHAHPPPHPHAYQQQPYNNAFGFGYPNVEQESWFSMMPAQPFYGAPMGYNPYFNAHPASPYKQQQPAQQQPYKY